MPLCDLTYREFNAIHSRLPSQQNVQRGRPWLDHRRVLNGIGSSLRRGGNRWDGVLFGKSSGLESPTPVGERDRMRAIQ